jgi:hypothetical protein
MKGKSKGMWIPKEIWEREDLTVMERLFYSEITSLDNKDGCFAGNQYFSTLFSVSKTRVSVIINSLVSKKYLTSVLIYKEGTKQILHRVLNNSYTGYITKFKEGYITKQVEPIKDKFIDNNTVNNTILTIQDNNTVNESKPKENKPSNLLEVEEYFIFKKSNKDEAETFFEYYENIGWKVGRNPMKKWKLAANKWIKTARPKFNNEKPSLAKKYFPEMFEVKGDPFETNLKLE